MRSRSTAVLSIVAVSGLLLAGCATGSSSSPSTASALPVVDSSVSEPAPVGERVGADGRLLEVWSGIVPDDNRGPAEEGSQWVTANVAQWVTAEGYTGADVAPVLRSMTDDSFSAEAEAQHSVAVEMVPGKSYTYVWSFQVPDALVDPADLVLCVGGGDEGCSLLTR